MTGADLIALLKKHPVGVVCLIIALLCGAGYFVRGDKVGERQEMLAARTKEAQAMAANLRNAAGLPEQTEAIQAAVRQVEGRLIKANQLAINQQLFFRLENETAVRLVDIRQGGVPAGRAAAKTQYIGVPFTLSVQGSYKQVTDFLQRLERGPGFCKFSSLSFTKLAGSSEGSASTGAGLMSISLSIELLGTP